MPVNTQCLNTFKFWIKLLQIKFKTFEQVLNIFIRRGPRAATISLGAKMASDIAQVSLPPPVDVSDDIRNPEKP